MSDFENLIAAAKEGDFVFADPPYTVRHNYNGFIKYNEILFSWKDQQRLANALLQAARRGVKIICTNANHESVRSLYDFDEFEQIQVSRNSSISAKSSSRKSFEELIVRANI
ncbi:Modification methylase DpnIIA [compost metagenome]